MQGNEAATVESGDATLCQSTSNIYLYTLTIRQYPGTLNAHACVRIFHYSFKGGAQTLLHVIISSCHSGLRPQVPDCPRINLRTSKQGVPATVWTSTSAGYLNQTALDNLAILTKKSKHCTSL